MITILLLIVGVIFVLAGGVLLINIAHAPEGYEDESGFHFGKEPGILTGHSVVSKARKVRSTPRAISQQLPAT